MTARAITALALTAAVVGCSQELPPPKTANDAPRPIATFVDGRIAPSPPEPCHVSAHLDTDLEWKVSECERPYIPTVPPPTPLAFHEWSQRDSLLDADAAPWKRREPPEG